MNIRVVISQTYGGRNIADVIDNDMGLPYCAFLSTYLREMFDSYNSMEAAAHATLFGIQFFERQGIDVIQRVKDGEFFTRDESDDFKRVCNNKKSKVLVLESKNVASIYKLSSKQLDNLIHETTQSKDFVGSGTKKGRLSYFVRYIDHLYTLWHTGNKLPEAAKERFEDFKRSIELAIKLIKPQKKKGGAIDPFEQAIPSVTYFDLLAIIQPSHARNPFTESVRLRNQLIVQILNESAIRVGALSKLKISDLRDDASAPRFHVTRTPNDITDTRIRPGSQKTNEHISALSPTTMEKLMLYIETDRNGYDAAQTHDFIFVSAKGKTKGQPLATSSAQSVVNVLSVELKFHLHAHLFRYKWQEVFEVQAKKAGYSNDQINDMRKQACGWSENTQMIAVYNELMNAVNVMELSKIRTSEFMPELNINKKDL